MPEPIPEPMSEPTWQPISALPMLTAHVDGGVQLAAEHLATLQQASDRPGVLDNATVDSVVTTFTTTRQDLELFAEQGRRWQAEQLTDTDRAGVARYVALVARERELVEAILALAEQLRAGTIETVLAKSDLEAGLEFLANAGRRADVGRRATPPPR